MKKIGLLMYSCDWFRGGLWRYSYNLSKSLLEIDQNNQHVFIHGMKKEDNFLGLERAELVLPMKNYQKILQLPDYLKYDNFDIVHQTENMCPLFFKKHSYKKIITIHDLTPLKFPRFFSSRDYFIYKFYLPEALKRVDRIIAPSLSTKNDLINFYNLDPEKISVINEGLEEAFFCEYSSEELTKFRQDKGLTKQYLFVVGFNYHRNLDTLFNAYSRLRADIKESLEIIIVGKIKSNIKSRFIGRGDKDLMRVIQKLDLAKNIRFLDVVSDEDLKMYYHCALALTFPSFSEGFGFPPLEAMACSCPVISSNASSMPEIIQGAGMLLDPKDIDLWKESIEKVFNSSKLREELKLKGIKMARQFSWERCAREHLKVYYN